jgi:hypothetical protein
MEIVTQILKHLPAGWPRIIALVGLGMLFFFPELRRLLTQRHRNKENLDLAKQLLELRQLELTVVDLKSKHPEAKNVNLDGRIQEIFSEPTQTSEANAEPKLTEPIAWVDRLKFAMIGSFSLMLLGSIALWHSGKFLGGNVVQAILIELGLAVLCGFIASAIPCRSRWECVFRGFLIPALLGALAVAAKGNT